MTDAREIIAGACFDRETAGLQAIAIMTRLTAAGFRIIGKDEVDQVTVEKCAAEVVERMLRFADTTSEADIVISEAIRAIGRKA